MQLVDQTRKYFQVVSWLIPFLVLLSILGFNKSYFHLFPFFKETSWIVHFHVISVFCWFGLLVSQALLAKKGKFEWHHKIGSLSYVLVPIILIGFVLVTNYGRLRHKAPDLLGATFFDGSLFLLFYVLAMVHRKNVHSHASYMILSAIPFINPGLGRFISPEVSVPIEFLLIIGLGLMALYKKRPYKPYVVALGSMIVLLGVIVYISVVNPSIIEYIWKIFWG